MSKKLSIVLGVFLVAALGVSGFFLISNENIKRSTDTIKKEITSRTKLLDQYQKQRNTRTKLNAREILEKAKEQDQSWAIVLEKILKYEGSNTQFNTFTMNSNNQVTINGNGNSVVTVARLLENLKKDSNFDNVFIKGVSQDTKTNSVLKSSFSLVFNFIPSPALTK